MVVPEAGDGGAARSIEVALALRDLRGRLPGDCRLGITGLLDWSANGDPKGLEALAGTVDEIVCRVTIRFGAYGPP